MPPVRNPQRQRPNDARHRYPFTAATAPACVSMNLNHPVKPADFKRLSPAHRELPVSGILLLRQP